MTYEDARPWARSIKTASRAAQMPPWHIDKTVGIQHFKNDRSLNDEQIATIVKWVDEGAPQGRSERHAARRCSGPTTRAGLRARSSGRRAGSDHQSHAVDAEGRRQDTWWKPVVDTGLTEAALGSRDRNPSEHGQGPQDHASRASRDCSRTRPIRSRGDRADANGAPQAGTFMEWAVGKQGEIMRPNTGKLMLPGSKIVWDIHYSNGRRRHHRQVELGIYFYPKGQEPKFRQVLAL